jgi:adenine-specific DNA glycosylase
VDHAYSHFRVTLHAYRCRARGRLRAPAARWVAPAEAAALALPATTRRILQSALAGRL